MAFNKTPDKWKDWYGSGTFPELLDMFREAIEAKRNSRILIKKKDIVWDSRHPQANSASVIDPRLGFANSLANLGLGEIDPSSSTGKHKHGEAMIYIIKGRGYSVINDKRYDWEEGDGLYVPPDTFHQHFNIDQNEKVLFLRVVPGPIQMNLVAIAASLNMVPAYSLQQAEARPGYEGKLEVLQKQLKG